MSRALRPSFSLQLFARRAVYHRLARADRLAFSDTHTHGRGPAAVVNTASEPPGDYWIGRRYYKNVYKFWGYVRRPGQPWSTAQLVMMNEQQKLAPDRAGEPLGSDNNYEYKLYGDFSGESVYEPASNSIYPEFVLEELRADLAQSAANFQEPVERSRGRVGQASAD